MNLLLQHELHAHLGLINGEVASQPPLPGSCAHFPCFFDSTLTNALNTGSLPRLVRMLVARYVIIKSSDWSISVGY